MGSFAYASKILLVVVILVSLKLNHCFEISKFTTLRIKAAIDRFEKDYSLFAERMAANTCHTDTHGGRIHITRNLVVGRVKVIR